MSRAFFVYLFLDDCKTLNLKPNFLSLSNHLAKYMLTRYYVILLDAGSNPGICVKGAVRPLPFSSFPSPPHHLFHSPLLSP